MPIQPAKVDNLTGPVEAVFTNFGGGLDWWSAKTTMPPNTAWLTENCFSRREIFDPNFAGALNSRPGLLLLHENPLGAGAGRLTNIRYVSTRVAATGNFLFVLETTTGRIYSTPWPGPIAYTLRATVAGATEMRAVSAAGYGIFCVYGPGGVGGMYSFDGTTFALIIGAPQARYIAFHQNRVFVAGMDANTTRLQFSDLRAPLVGYGLNLIDDVDDDSGWQITGLLDFQGTLIVTTGIKIFALAGSGPPDYSLYNINQAVGCSAPDSLTTDGDSIYFLSNRGFIRWDTHGEAEYISRPVWTYLRDDFDPDFASGTLSAYFNWGLYSSYRNFEGTDYNRAINLDLMTGGWFPTSKDSWKLSGLTSVENGEYLLAGDAANGRLYQVVTGTSDNGVGITSFWRHAHTDLGHPTAVKLLNHIEILAEVDSGTQRLELNVYRDFGLTPESMLAASATDIDLRATGTGARMSVATVDSSRTNVLFRATPSPSQKHFRTMSWEIKRTSATTPFTVLAVKVVATLYPTVP